MKRDIYFSQRNPIGSQKLRAMLLKAIYIVFALLVLLTAMIMYQGIKNRQTSQNQITTQQSAELSQALFY